MLPSRDEIAAAVTAGTAAVSHGGEAETRFPLKQTLPEPTRDAIGLFPSIARNYERWAAILSMGQDAYWRREMVARLPAPRGGAVLDIAAGTGLITRELQRRGHQVVALDLNPEMLAGAIASRASAVQGVGQTLPFADGSFEGATFGYLLRYVPDPLETLREVARVVRPGGVVGMVEFGRPRGIAGPLWVLYTRLVLPASGLIAGLGWTRVGRFLGPNIDAFHRRHPEAALVAMWEAAGFEAVRVARRSLGGGLLMWGRRR